MVNCPPFCLICRWYVQIMSNIWSKEETLWSFALYGTAVGAGTLFLPIQLGSAGAVVLFITALVARPLTYWPHKALCQFILSSKTSAGEGITGAVTHYYGKKIGNLITTLYFIAFLSSCWYMQWQLPTHLRNSWQSIWLLIFASVCWWVWVLY